MFVLISLLSCSILFLSAKSLKQSNYFRGCFELALSSYPSLPLLEWDIINADSIRLKGSLELDIVAIGNCKDTTHYIEFTISESLDTVIYYLFNYTTVYSIFDTIYHTEYNYDSVLAPKVKYKFTRQNPENVIIEYGEDRIHLRHSP